MPTIVENLDALFHAERKVRSLHATLLEQDRSKLVSELGNATKSALALPDDADATLRLTRIALILSDLEGDVVVDLLIDILGGPLAEARIIAGDALEALAFDRFKEVALGVERALDRLPTSSPALTELPFLLAEVGEPGCVKLLGRFLAHPNAEVVAASIEAIAELGDPAAIPLLTPVEKDSRQVQLDEDSGEGERIAIGDLAFEARELLLHVEQHDHEISADGRKGSPAKKRR
ncbi:MAG: HEAT repeat domain-containing protein [Polyangiaceae bacterium]|nr:HEAT repeat domain-containing protein [Polyangiaceae bacterium]